MSKYRIGFSLTGFVAFLIPMLPNLIWMLLPGELNELLKGEETSPLLDLLENLTRFSFIILLILLIRKESRKTFYKRWIAGVGLLSLLGYLLLWMLVYQMGVTPLFLFGMALLPSIYFICVCVFQENNPAFIAAILFAAIHISRTIQSL